MREDDYTGSLIGDDDEDAFIPADADLYEFDADDEALADEFATLAENEQTVSFAHVADGAKSLREAADQLYEYADELVAMAEDGWEIVDTISDGRGVAVRFDAIEDPE